MSCHPTLFTLCTLFACVLLLVQGKNVPLNEDREGNVPRKLQQLRCFFGGKYFELEEEWHPDLGAPFGLMACIKCKCLTIQLKRRIIGRVACKNFVDQCPKPDCQSPVLLTGECCKTCPNLGPVEVNVFGQSEFSSDFPKDATFQEFMAVLTGRFRQPPVTTEGVGRAYLTLSRKDLHFSVHFDKLEEKPVSVQFLDKLNSIVFEKNLEKQHFLDKKICGVWSDLPLVYMKSLKKDEMSITLVTAKQQDGALGGKIFKPKIINREVFGSLLFPSTMQSVKNLGYGGVAVVDVDAGGDSLNVAVWFDASVDFSSGYSRHVFLSLEKDDGRRRVSQSVRADLMIKDGYYVAEKSIPISAYEQRWLINGQLLLVVSADYITPSEFIGLLQPKQTCDVYQAILNEESIGNGTLPQGVGGYSTLRMNKNCTISFQIKTTGFKNSDVLSVTVTKENRRHRRRPVATNDVPNLASSASFLKGDFGESLHLRDMEFYYKEKLIFEVAYKDGGSVMRGTIRRFLHSDTVQQNTEPILLAGFNVPVHPAHTAAGAVGWFTAQDNSNSCTLKYMTVISGLTVFKPEDLKMSLCRRRTDECFLSLRNYVVLTSEPSKMIINGESDDLYAPMWHALSANEVYAKISTPLHPDGELAGNLTIKNECWKRHVQQDLLVAEDSRHVAARRLECEYEGTTYNDGSSFNSQHQNCTLCNCQRGVIKCERVLCPVLNCSTPLVTMAGNCCPNCPDTRFDTSKSCHWMGEYYQAGASWHPYVPPFGFTKCALCVCQSSGEVSCTKTTCPEISCPKRLRYREKPLDCCTKCRDPSTVDDEDSESNGAAVMDDESNSGRCFFNNKWYNEHMKFSPKIGHLTTLKCIECVCRKGRVNCRRKNCANIPCDDPSRKGGCCPRCSGSSG